MASKLPSGWTLETYAAHNEALRLAEAKFQDERDRRYAEVKAAEEKALGVKEQADRKALELAREIQTYKDEKANELREQISSERGIYASKTDLVAAVEKVEATLQPVLVYISREQGKGQGIGLSWSILIAAVMLFIALYTFSNRPVAPMQIPSGYALVPSTPVVPTK